MTAEGARALRGEEMSNDIARSLGRLEAGQDGLRQEIANYRRETETAINALRQDVVHSVTEVRRDIKDHEGRIKVLEGDRSGDRGVATMFRRVASAGSLFIAFCAVLVAYFK